MVPEVRRVFGAEIGFGLHAEINGKVLSATSYDDNNPLKDSYTLHKAWGARKEDILEQIKIPGHNDKGFLSNGARFYIDQLVTPEYCTPEVSSAEHLVLYELSAEKFMLNVLRALKETKVIDKYYLNKRTTDQLGNSWGYHENILSNVPVSKQNIDLIAAFNVTRAIYTGAGGLVKSSKDEFQYVTSPRLYVSRCLSQPSRTGVNKPIVCEDNTNFENTHYRMHQVSSDATLSPWSIRMKHATNSLLVKALESGQDFSVFHIEEPIEAAATIVGDLALKSVIELKNGIKIKPHEWQTEFADELSMYFETDEFTKDEQWALDQIYEVCDDLACDPLLAANRVEWVARREYLREVRDRLSDSNNTLRNADYTWDSLNRQGVAVAKRKNGWGWHGFKNKPTDKDINHAMLNPPQNTRAAYRAKLIREDEASSVFDWHIVGEENNYIPPFSK